MKWFTIVIASFLFLVTPIVIMSAMRFLMERCKVAQRRCWEGTRSEACIRPSASQFVGNAVFLLSSTVM